MVKQTIVMLTMILLHLIEI